MKMLHTIALGQGKDVIAMNKLDTTTCTSPDSIPMAFYLFLEQMSAIFSFGRHLDYLLYQINSFSELIPLASLLFDLQLILKLIRCPIHSSMHLCRMQNRYCCYFWQAIYCQKESLLPPPSQPVIPLDARKELLRTLEKLILLNTNPSQLATPSIDTNSFVHYFGFNGHHCQQRL